jgi:hypothetical protein
VTVSITHAKVSGQPAGNDPNRVYGTHWDEDHVVPVATEQQVIDGTSEDVLLTPASLTQKAATQGEMDAGTSTTKLVTPSVVNYTAPVDNAVARPYIKKFGEEISIRDFLPAASATTHEVEIDNTIATNIFDYTFDGNRKLYLPQGRYVFTNGATNPASAGGTGTGYCFLIQGNTTDGAVENVSIIGAGSGATTVYGADGADLGFLSFLSVNNILIQGIRFENDRDSNAEEDGSGGSQHGFVGNGSAARGWANTNVTIRDVQVIGARGYGIGLQGENGQDTHYQNWVFDNVWIENCSNDGIDVKNPTDTDNNNFRLNNIMIKNFALQQDWDTREFPPTVVVGDGDLWRNAEYAGIDIRSAWTHMTNITVIHDALHTGNPAGSGSGPGNGEPITDVSGIRARSNGNSQKMHISNFYIKLSNNGNSASDLATVGIDFEDDSCIAINGHIEGCDRAVMVQGDNCSVSHVTINDCHHGITGSGSGNSYHNIKVTNGTAGAVNIGAAVDSFFTDIRVDTVGDVNEGHWLYAEEGATNLLGLKRTTADTLTWVNTSGTVVQTLSRAIAGTANEITVTNADGVAGAPTLSLPSALTFTGKTVTGGTLNDINVGAATELTIAAGVVTATKTYHTIDTEADAASDDLDTINGGSVGDFLIIRAANGSRDVVVKHGTGNIKGGGGGLDRTLANTNMTVSYIYDGTNWTETSFGNVP